MPSLCLCHTHTYTHTHRIGCLFIFDYWFVHLFNSVCFLSMITLRTNSSFGNWRKMKNTNKRQTKKNTGWENCSFKNKETFIYLVISKIATDSSVFGADQQSRINSEFWHDQYVLSKHCQVGVGNYNFSQIAFEH